MSGMDLRRSEARRWVCGACYPEFGPVDISAINKHSKSILSTHGGRSRGAGRSQDKESGRHGAGRTTSGH